MNMKMLVGGIAGGAAGVVVWVIVGLMGYEVGYVAWLIGLLVGMGTRAFNYDDSALGGLSAAATAAAMVLLGKLIVLRIVAGGNFPFSAMFAGWDILWFLLACGTAARLGWVGEGDE